MHNPRLTPINSNTSYDTPSLYQPIEALHNNKDVLDNQEAGDPILPFDLEPIDY